MRFAGFRKWSVRLATCLVTSSLIACASSPTVVAPDPPGVSHEMLDEIDSGVCPVLSDWVLEQYVPYMFGVIEMKE